MLTSQLALSRLWVIGAKFFHGALKNLFWVSVRSQHLIEEDGRNEDPAINVAPDVKGPFVFTVKFAKPLGIDGSPVMSVVPVHLLVLGGVCLVRPDNVSHRFWLLADSAPKPAGIV